MTQNDRNQESRVENAANIPKKGLQSATNYVQNAVEHAAGTSQDATQNLVNNVMNQEKDNE